MFLTTQLVAQSLSYLSDRQRSAGNMASAYMPVDSWVYPAFELLASKGLVQSAFFNMRPWTRLTCARLVDEAEDLAVDRTPDNDTLITINALKKEFAAELARRTGRRNVEALLESASVRFTGIAGKPLTDGYHFAETLVDDDGRPFGEGANAYVDLAVRGTAGPFAVYARAEMQRAGSALLQNLSTQQQIAVVDFTPVAEEPPISSVLRGKLLEANLALTLSNNQFTFGKQTLWWGPARSGATLFSNNAEPITMLRYDRVRPIELPGPFSLLGPISAQFLLGRLSGAQFLHTDSATFGSPGRALRNQPWIHAEKVTFEPTPNFQFGVSRSTLFAGQGAPFTAHSLLRSLFSTGTQDERLDPGDRRVAFDARYRIPGLRECMTGYVDTFTEDEPFPLLYPRRSVWMPGFSLRCFTHPSRLTIRAEGLLAPHRNEFPGYYYFNVHYLSGYTNNRQLIGSWIGREGNGEQMWATWQMSPMSSIELSGRSMTSAATFLRGGTVRDLTATVDLAVKPEWQLRLQAQTEWWHFPALADSPQRNTACTMQLTYRPQRRSQ
jgi:hypothetical protein